MNYGVWGHFGPEWPIDGFIRQPARKLKPGRPVFRSENAENMPRGRKQRTGAGQRVAGTKKPPCREVHLCLTPNHGAQGETRTPTGLPPLRPERSASTNSATWAPVLSVPPVRGIAGVCGAITSGTGAKSSGWPRWCQPARPTIWIFSAAASAARRGETRRPDACYAPGQVLVSARARRSVPRRRFGRQDVMAQKKDEPGLKLIAK